MLDPGAKVANMKAELLWGKYECGAAELVWRPLHCIAYVDDVLPRNLKCESRMQPHRCLIIHQHVRIQPSRRAVIADPLSVADFVAGLVSLAIQLSQLSFQYVSSVTGSSKGWSSYIQELSTLTSVLLKL